ncbi:MAG: type II secretion system F family protein [Nitriliruptoraceae bacterium]
MSWRGRSNGGDGIADIERLQLAVEAGLPIGTDVLYGVGGHQLAPPAPHNAGVDATARIERVVHVATATGGSISAALDAVMESEDDRLATRRAVDVASAQSKTVAGILLLVPVVMVPGLSVLTGIDLAAFYRSPVGSVVGAVGIGLVVFGAVAIVAVVRWRGTTTPRPRPRGTGARASATASPMVASTDEAADLVATAVSSGMPLPWALKLVAGVIPCGGARLRRMAMSLELGVIDGRSRDGSLEAVIHDAWTFGAPVAPALRRVAARQRAHERARALRRAERLPVLLALPTALCLLPGTVLLVGAPIVHSGMTAALGGL